MIITPQDAQYLHGLQIACDDMRVTDPCSVEQELRKSIRLLKDENEELIEENLRLTQRGAVCDVSVWYVLATCGALILLMAALKPWNWPFIHRWIG